MNAPTLVVVCGYPASGKTTLARGLAAGLRYPIITKDDIKEAMGDVLGGGDLSWSHTLGQATYAVMFRVSSSILGAGVSMIAESNFDHDLSTSSLRRLVVEHGAHAVRVVMTADGDVLLERYRRRAAAGERHPVHLDDANLDRMAELVAQPYVPPDVPGPIIEVEGDDLDAVDLRVIARRVEEALTRPGASAS